MALDQTSSASSEAIESSCGRALQLSVVAVRNFRSLADTGPLTIQDQMTLLIGENDGGKSSFIRSVGFLLGQRSIDPQDHTFWDPESPPEEPIEVIGTFGPMGSTSLDNTVRVRAALSSSGSYSREVEKRCHVDLNADPDSLSINELRSHASNLRISLPGGTAKQPILDAVKDWLSVRPDSEFILRWMELDKDIEKQLPRYTEFSASAASDPEQTIKTIANRETRRILQDEQLHVEALETIGKEIDLTIQERVTHITRRISAYCPDIDEAIVNTSVDFRQPAVSVGINWRRGGRDYDLRKAGDGRRRRITLAVHEADHEVLAGGTGARSEFIAYDEPDTHLDHAAQRALFDILARQGSMEHVQVLAATHSLSFIDKVELGAVIQFRLNADLHTEVNSVADSSEDNDLAFISKICAGLGLRNSALLTERCFLVVEGETEHAALPWFFQHLTGSSLAASGITILNAKGSGSVCRVIETLLCQLDRQVVLLIDSDVKHSSAGVFRPPWLSDYGFKDGHNLFYIGDQEFEDAFQDATWTEVLNEAFAPTDDNGDWTQVEIQLMRDKNKKFSRELETAVRRRCKRRVSKPDLGIALGRLSVSGHGIPPDLKTCLEQVRSLASQ